MAGKPIDLFISRLDGVRCSNGQYQARCPAHDDKSPSLGIKEVENGMVIFNCLAGCSKSDILDAVDLKFSDLYADSAKPQPYDKRADMMYLTILDAHIKKGNPITENDKNEAEMRMRRVKGDFYRE